MSGASGARGATLGIPFREQAAHMPEEQAFSFGTFEPAMCASGDGEALRREKGQKSIVAAIVVGGGSWRLWARHELKLRAQKGPGDNVAARRVRGARRHLHWAAVRRSTSAVALKLQRKVILGTPPLNAVVHDRLDAR
jgi:hypothetical protein